MELDDSFAKLLGASATDAEREKLFLVRDALGLKNNDALWLVLVALQHYETSYEKFPALIADAAKKTLDGVSDTAKASFAAASAEAQADLAKAVGIASQDVAKSVAGKERAKWLAIAVTACSVAFAGFGWLMFDLGSKAGAARAGADAKDEKAAIVWAATPEGRAAYQLAKMGSIGKLTRCDEAGWKITKGVCYPLKAEDGSQYGWRVQP